jgi:hypothetical protein
MTNRYRDYQLIASNTNYSRKLLFELAGILLFHTNKKHSNRQQLVLAPPYNFHNHRNTDTHLSAFPLPSYARIQDM